MPPAPISGVLFVCHGNICRSPMAEALFAREIEARPALRRLRVGSAGVGAGDGDAASAEAVEVMRDVYDIDIRAHRSRRLTNALAADLVLTMDGWIAASARRVVRNGRVETLGDYAGFPGEVVDDPIGWGRDVYSACAEQLDRLVRAAAARIDEEIQAERRA